MQDASITIRPLEATDSEPISAAFAAIGWSKPVAQYAEYFAEQEAGARDVLVATLEGQFAGYVTLAWRSDYAPFLASGTPEIQDLNVLPRFTNRGIGSCLMDAVEDVARARASVVGLGVGLCPDYGAAQRLYVRRAYIPDGHGIAYRNRTVAYGEQVTADDDLVLCLTKEL